MFFILKQKDHNWIWYNNASDEDDAAFTVRKLIESGGYTINQITVFKGINMKLKSRVNDNPDDDILWI